ncbi:MAG: hypothetical protein NTX34_07360 [Cytophagales bacterium]|nr:hypothetical protein [Cytophagales bacterium]
MFTIFSILLNSCGNSNEEKAKDAIRTYLNENLDDMSTYEPVKFGELEPLTNKEVGEFYDVNLESRYQMFHSFRVVNKEGRKVLIKSYFLFNETLTITQDPTDIDYNGEIPMAK